MDKLIVWLITAIIIFVGSYIGISFIAWDF